MEKRLAAILISDIVGYTKLMEGDTEGTVMAWSDARDNVVDPQVEASNGRLVKFMGDGFLAEFSTVQTALECAIAIQNGVRANSLKFRMAVHLGDIIDDGRDIYATLYAQKMFFIVEIRQREVFFEVIPYLDARNQSELNLQKARRKGSEDLSKWENLFTQTFL